MKYIIIGSFGVGKTSVSNRLIAMGYKKVLKCINDSTSDIKHCTDDYRFLSSEEFAKYSENKEFLIESNSGSVNYGVLKSDFYKYKDAVLVVDQKDILTLNKDDLLDTCIVKLKATTSTLYERATLRGDDLNEFQTKLKEERDYLDAVENLCNIIINTNNRDIQSIVNLLLYFNEKENN